MSYTQMIMKLIDTLISYNNQLFYILADILRENMEDCQYLELGIDIRNLRTTNAAELDRTRNNFFPFLNDNIFIHINIFGDINELCFRYYTVTHTFENNFKTFCTRCIRLNDTSENEIIEYTIEHCTFNRVQMFHIVSKLTDIFFCTNCKKQLFKWTVI